MAFDELKQKQSVMWGSAPFERVADELTDIHDDLVDGVDPQPDEAALDVACGTGAVAERIARRAARVTGIDFAPTLVATARRRADAAGLDIRYDVGDAEALPYEDASFDVVVSAFGHMFAPDHRAAAAELARVCRPGGRLGLACWTPEGGIGDMFRMVASFQPAPPPPDLPSPLEWGRPDYQHELLADTFELEIVERESPQHGESGEQLWQLFSTSFGPSKTLVDALEPDRAEEYHQATVEFYERYRKGDGISHPRQYLLTIGRRL
jgi:SAM-dependent methyltransferase